MGIACSEEDPSADSEADDLPEEIVVEIGEKGGTVKAKGVSLMIPEGALDKNVMISAKILDSDKATIPSNTKDVSAVYEFGPKGTKFNKPVQVQIETDKGEPTAKMFFTKDGDETQFEQLASVSKDKQVTASTKHFSLAFAGIPLDGQLPHGGDDAGAGGDGDGLDSGLGEPAIDSGKDASAAEKDAGEDPLTPDSGIQDSGSPDSGTDPIGEIDASADDDGGTDHDASTADGGIKDGGFTTHDGGAATHVDGDGGEADGGTTTISVHSTDPLGAPANLFEGLTSPFTVPGFRVGLTTDSLFVLKNEAQSIQSMLFLRGSMPGDTTFSQDISFSSNGFTPFTGVAMIINSTTADILFEYTVSGGSVGVPVRGTVNVGTSNITAQYALVPSQHATATDRYRVYAYEDQSTVGRDVEMIVERSDEYTITLPAAFNPVISRAPVTYAAPRMVFDEVASATSYELALPERS